jgi:hypothetical protein
MYVEMTIIYMWFFIPEFDEPNKASFLHAGVSLKRKYNLLKGIIS